MEYGKRLNPECSLRTPKGIKGTRQKVIVTHNEIDQAQELLVRFPNLGSDDVIIPGTANLSFNIELTSTIDANRTLVSNVGRAIIEKLAVKFEGNEIMSVDDFDVLVLATPPSDIPVSRFRTQAQNLLWCISKLIDDIITTMTSLTFTECGSFSDSPILTNILFSFQAIIR